MALVCALCCAFGLAACGGGEDNSQPSVTPKIAQANVNVSFDFEIEDYIASTGHSFYFGDWSSGWSDFTDDTVINIEPHETTHFDDAALKITFKSGYNLETLGITEKDGKPVTREYDTQYNNTIIIKMPFDENLDYSLTLTAPDAIYETVGFEVDEQSGLENISSGAYLNLLTNTQVYVNDNEGHAGFVNLTREDTVNQNDRIFNIGQTSIEADMSKTYFAVYVRFDSSNPGRVIYDEDYEKLFTFDGLTGSVEYAKIPETNEYAYAFKFYTSRISETNSRLKLNTQYLKNIGNREDFITKNFSVITYKDENGFQYTYKFELISYQIDSGEFKTDNLNNFKKEYGKSYTLKYQFKDIDIKTPSYGDYDKDELKETLIANTDFSQIKLTVNGEKITSLYFDDAEKVYRFTIGATKVPYDYNEDLGNEFTVNADKTTINAIPSNNVYNLTVSKQVGCTPYNGGNLTVFNKYETENEIKFICIVKDKDYTISGSISLGDFSKFNLKITLNGVVRYTKTYTSGVDYFKSVTDKTGYEAFGNANIFENFEYSDEYVFGSYEESHISLVFTYEGNLRIEINDKGNTSSGTDIKIELSEVETRRITFDAKGELYGGSFTIDGEEITTVEVDKEFMAILTLSDLPRDSYDSYDYKYELYSNGVHIATTSFGSDVSMFEGYKTYDLYVMGSGSSGFGGTFYIYTKVNEVYVTFKPQTDDQTGESEKVMVLIDKIVLNVFPTYYN